MKRFDLFFLFVVVMVVVPYQNGVNAVVEAQTSEELNDYGGSPEMPGASLAYSLDNGGLVYASTPARYVPSPAEGPTPNAPTNLQVSSSSNDSISVSWDDNSSIEDVYEVWYQAPSDTWHNPSVPANSTSFTITGLECNTEYNVVVRAVRWEGGDAYYSESNWESAPTASCGTAPALSGMPYWKALLLVYRNIDVNYTDSAGVPRHLTHSLPQAEIEDAVAAFRRYPALVDDGSNGESFVQTDIVYVDRPLTSLTSMGNNMWWPSPEDTRPELDAYVPQNYDSVLVFWPQTNTATGQQIPSHWGLGLWAPSWSNGATYATVANIQSWAWEVPSVGEPWLHEWLHGVSPYYGDKGYPMPSFDADGADEHGYVRSPTSGWMDYYRDLMTGNVLENNKLTGITAEAWQSGSVLGNSARIFSDHFRKDSLDSYEQIGSVIWDSSNERVQMNSSPPGGNKIYADVSFQRDFTVVGRVNIPQSDIGLYDSISLILGNGQVEYWGTLAYGTSLAERNHISIMRNDVWGTLYPITLSSGWYTVKMQVDQGPGLLRMKVWPDGMNEPGWQVTRTLDADWKVTNMGYRHFGTATTFVDDIYGIEEKQKIYLPMTMR